MTEAQLLSDPTFLAKVAAAKNQLTGAYDPAELMVGILAHFKEAGYDPLWTMGFLEAIAVSNGMGIEKCAGATDWANSVGQAIGGWWESPGILQNTANAVQSGALKGLGNGLEQGGIAAHLLNPQTFEEKATKFIFTGANGKFDLDKATHALMNLRGGYYAGAAGKFYEGLSSNPTVRQWGSYLIPAAGTFAAGKLLGMNTGTAAVLGAGVGGLAGGAAQYGGLAGLTNHLQQSIAPGTQPIFKDPAKAAPAPVPVPSDAAMADTHDAAASVGAAATAAGTSPTAASARPAPAQ